MKAESNSETKSWLKYFLSSKKELFLNFEAIKVYAHEWERINQDEKIIDNQDKYKRLQKELEDIFDKSDDDFVKVIIGVAFVKGFTSVIQDVLAKLVMKKKIFIKALMVKDLRNFLINLLIAHCDCAINYYQMILNIDFLVI